MGNSERGLDRLDELALVDAGLGFCIDLSAMGFSSSELDGLSDRMADALRQMAELEGGAIANPDEGRMVGHYWLRAPELAPVPEQRDAILDAQRQVHELAQTLRAGGRFSHAIIVGIGGSSLGPQLVYDALGCGSDGLRLLFLNNTDPDGIDRIVASVALDRTLTVVISKSGGTKETRNGMLELRHAYQARGLTFGQHAVAITSAGSQLDSYAIEHGFIARLPMWDWVGGRTSVTSTVGLLPAALQGADTAALLAGAAAMDALTRRLTWRQNPAALLAAAWFLAARDMVMLPYKDRLELTSRYLQQLVMESLGKAEDLDGNVVHQGIVVYGNKGSTDQHAYVQQLLDGADDFFVTFVEVLVGRVGESLQVEPGVTTGDYLSGFLHGTRRALAARGRRSLTLTFERVDARSLGALIALYERAVGLYAGVVNINAYHQPAVESGKKAAAAVLDLQGRVVAALSRQGQTPASLAAVLGEDHADAVFRVLRHLVANGRARVETVKGQPPWRWRYASS